MEIIGLLFILQIACTLAAAMVYASALRTRRTRRSRHLTFTASAILLALVALGLAVVSMVGLMVTDHMDPLMMLLPAFVTLVLAGLTGYRSASARAPRRSLRQASHL